VTALLGICVICLAGVAVLPSRALAALPAPAALDAAGNGNAPYVVYDSGTGTTYVAWSAPDNQNGGSAVDLCVELKGDAGCDGGGPVLLTDPNPMYTGSNTISLGGLVVLPGGEAVVLGTAVADGTVAWASAAGGAGFLAAGNGLQNGGDPISPVSLFYTRDNAVALGSTDVGLFDSYDHEYSYFSDSPFAGPQTPATLPEETGNANNGGQFDNQGGSVLAAEPAPAPAPAGSYVVVGAGANLGVTTTQSTPAGCVNSAATGYGTAVGIPGASGTLNAEGLAPNGFSLLACSAEAPALTSGGKTGIGLLEEEGNAVDNVGSNLTMDWRPFHATATGGSFGAPVQLQDLTSHVLVDVDTLEAAEDSGTGVYALWTDEEGLELDYSPDSGATWEPPVTVPRLSNDEDPGDPAIAGVSDGTLELAYDSDLGPGDRVYLQTIDYADLLPPPVVAPLGSTTPSTASISVTCAAGSPCAGTATITVPTIPGKSAHSARLTPVKRGITLGTARFSLKAGHRKLLAVRLRKRGRKVVARDHGRLTATVLISVKSLGHTVISEHKIRFVAAAPKR
jgi:hypothetical protein